MSILRRTFPIISTAFVNKCGDIGMYLFPMLLVERAFSTEKASSVLFFSKTALLIGTFGGGWVSKKIGHKATLILSLFTAGLGLSFIPLASGYWLLTFLAVLTRLGHGLYQAPIRLLIAYSVEKEEHQQESFAWLRTVNNLAQIFGYGLSFLGSTLGLLPFFLFDGLTSFFAALLGIKLVPNISVKLHETPRKISGISRGKSLWTFAGTVFCLSGFSLLIDLFILGTSAYCRIHLGSRGIAIFSLIMVLNTLLCTLLSVVASRRITNSRRVFPLGLVLCGAGILTVLQSNANLPLLFLGTLITTIGEIIFGTVSQVELLRALPDTKNRNELYSAALVFQSVGRIVGASLAFPIFQKGTQGTLPVLALVFGFTALSFFVGQNAPSKSKTEAKIPTRKAANH